MRAAPTVWRHASNATLRSFSGQQHADARTNTPLISVLAGGWVDGAKLGIPRRRRLISQRFALDP
jgi:hypothetical protein